MLEFKMKTTRRYFRANRSDIALIRFIFEAYDGIAVVSTCIPDRGQIVVTVAPGCEPDVEMILADLKKRIRIEEIDDAANGPLVADSMSGSFGRFKARPCWPCGVFGK
jgi:hypothetical protein